MHHLREDELLRDTESDDPPSLLHRQSKRSFKNIVLIILLAVTLSLFYGYNTLHDSTSTSYVSPTCGKSSVEARTKGCHYEPMLRSWIPDECYTPDPASEYFPFDDRLWFYDKNLTKSMIGSDLDVLRNGDDITAYTKYFHDEHCLYAWRKLALAVENRLSLVDSKTMSLHHSTHCSQRIARFIREVHTFVWNDSHTGTAPLMFQTCVPLFP